MTTHRLPLSTPQASGGFYNAVMALGPELYWRLDETSANQSITDASGNCNHGYFSEGAGDISIVPGAPGAVDGDAAVNFTNPPPGDPDAGVAAYGRAYDYSPFQPGAALTVLGLAKNNQVAFGSPFQTLFGSGPGRLTNDDVTLEVRNQSWRAEIPRWVPENAAPTVRWYANARIELDNFVTSTDFRSAWPLDGTEWVLWAFSFDHEAGGARLWINGREQARIYNGFATPQDFQGTEGTFQVGNRGKGSYEAWDGLLDEIAVFERVLTQAEIAGLVLASGLDLPDPS